VSKLDELEKLANSATPGPWGFGSFGRILVVPYHEGHPDKHSPICDLGEQHFPSDGQEYKDAAFIAAANPQTVKQMIALIRQCKEALGEIQFSNDSLWQGDRAFVALTAIEQFEKGTE